MKNLILISAVLILSACQPISSNKSSGSSNNSNPADNSNDPPKPIASAPIPAVPTPTIPVTNIPVPIASTPPKPPKTSVKITVPDPIASASPKPLEIPVEITPPPTADPIASASVKTPVKAKLTDEEIKNNLIKAIDDNNEALLDSVEKKYITSQIAHKAIEKNSLSMLKKLYAINNDIFKDKDNSLFSASDSKEIKEFIASKSSHEAKEKYVKNNLKTDEGIENLKKTFADLEPSTINGFLWPIKDEGFRIAPRSVLKDTLIQDDDAEKLSKLLDIIDLTKKDNYEDNLLHYAASLNATKVFKILFNKQSDLLKQKNKGNFQPLDRVLLFKNDEVIKFIINNAVLDKDEQQKILTYALNKQRKEVQEELVTKYPKLYNEKVTLNNKTGLYLFLADNKNKNDVYKNTNKEVIYNDVMTNLADNNYKDKFIETMRNLSKDNGYEILWYKGENSLMRKFINDNNIGMIDRLTNISKRFDVTTNLDASTLKGPDSNNVLHYAALSNKSDVFFNFLDKNMLNEENAEGKTALDIALEQKNSNIITSLLKNRDSINMSDDTYQKIIANNPMEWATLVINTVESGDKSKLEKLATKDPDIYKIVDKSQQPLFFSAKNNEFKNIILDKTPAEVIKNRIISISQKSDSFLTGLKKETCENKILEIIKDYLDNFDAKKDEFTKFIDYLSKTFVTNEMVAYAIEKDNLTALKKLASKKGSASQENINKILEKNNPKWTYYLIEIFPTKDIDFFNKINNETYMTYVAIEIAKNLDIRSLKKISELKLFDNIKNKYLKKDAEQKNILVVSAIEKATTQRYCDYYQIAKHNSKRPEFTKKITDFLEALSTAGVKKEYFAKGILQNSDGTPKIYPGCMNEDNTAWYFKEVQDKLKELSQK